MATLAGGEEAEWMAVIRSDLVQRRSIVGDEPKIELLYHSLGGTSLTTIYSLRNGSVYKQ